jgi:hypothetical protein
MVSALLYTATWGTCFLTFLTRFFF